MMELEKKVGAGLPDPDAIAWFKSHELAAVALMTYTEWINEYSLRHDSHAYLVEFDDWFKWAGETEVLLDAALSEVRKILVFSAGTGDEGGPALVTVHLELPIHRSMAWEIRSIVHEFDLNTQLVWADGKHQFVE